MSGINPNIITTTETLKNIKLFIMFGAAIYFALLDITSNANLFIFVNILQFLYHPVILYEKGL